MSRQRLHGARTSRCIHQVRGVRPPWPLGGAPGALQGRRASLPESAGARSQSSRFAPESGPGAVQSWGNEGSLAGIQPVAQERAPVLVRRAASHHSYRNVLLRIGGVRKSDSLSQGGGSQRSAESGLAPGSGAQLPVVQAVPMRSGHLSRDPHAERRVGRGRYAGRRSSGRIEELYSAQSSSFAPP